MVGIVWQTLKVQTPSYKFAKANTIILPGKRPSKVNVGVVAKALGLAREGTDEPKTTYPVS